LPAKEGFPEKHRKASRFNTNSSSLPLAGYAFGRLTPLRGYSLTRRLRPRHTPKIKRLILLFGRRQSRQPQRCAGGRAGAAKQSRPFQGRVASYPPPPFGRFAPSRAFARPPATGSRFIFLGAIPCGHMPHHGRWEKAPHPYEKGVLAPAARLGAKN
jgi:hypothetical protein